jgi:hypothetical protein
MTVESCHDFFLACGNDLACNTRKVADTGLVFVGVLSSRCSLIIPTTVFSSFLPTYSLASERNTRSSEIEALSLYYLSSSMSMSHAFDEN